MQWGKGLRPGGPYHPLLFVGKTFILFWYELHIKSKWERKMKRKKSGFSQIISDIAIFLKFSWEEGEGWPWRPIQTSPIPLLQIKIGSLVECGVLSFYQISESTSSVTAVLIKKFKYEMNFECFVSHSSSHWLKYNGWLLRLIQDFKTVLNLEKLFSFALFLDCFWK